MVIFIRLMAPRHFLKLITKKDRFWLRTKWRWSLPRVFRSELHLYLELQMLHKLTASEDVFNFLFASYWCIRSVRCFFYVYALYKLLILTSMRIETSIKSYKAEWGLIVWIVRPSQRITYISVIQIDWEWLRLKAVGATVLTVWWMCRLLFLSGWSCFADDKQSSSACVALTRA